jgi:hypothetical protein
MWRWLRRSSNQKVLALLGPAVAAVAVAAWAVFSHFHQEDGRDAGPRVQADHGVAAGGNIEGSTIRVEGGPSGGAKEK